LTIHEEEWQKNH